MLKIRLDKTKLSVSDNLVQIKTALTNEKNIVKECITDPNDCKFGEIYLALDGRIYYNCQFCDSNFYCFKAFSNHFLDEHAIDWTALIYPDGNFACCSKVEPDYSSFKANFEIIDEDVIVEDIKNETSKEGIDQEVVVEEEVEDDQHIQHPQVLAVKQDSFDSPYYILQQQYEPEEIIYKSTLNDQSFIKLPKETLEFKNEHEIAETESCHSYVQMIVKDENQVLEEEIYTQNEFCPNEDQIYEAVINDNNENDFIIELPKDIDLNFYQMPKHFFNTLRQISTQRCKFCDNKFSDLDAHYKLYLGKFVCHIMPCSEPFDCLDDLNEHIEELHSDAECVFKCFYCDFRDNEKLNLEAHYRKIHLLEKNFKCIKCGVDFFSQEELQAHDDAHIAFGELHPVSEKLDSHYSENMELNENVEYDEEHDDPDIKMKNNDSESDTSSGGDETDRRRRDNHHIEVDDPLHPHFISLMKQFHTRRCKICKVKSSLLSTHYRKIHFEKFTCDINQCSEPFDTEEELAAHTAELHVDPDNPFKCAYCDYKTTEKRRLSYHYRRNHLVEKKYQCNYCPMKFFYEKERVQHHRVHTGEHPFSCDLCGQAFKTAVIMRMHKKRKHEEPSESCNICGKLFSTKENLKNHLKRHLGTLRCICHICGMSFSRPQCLRNHLPIHSDATFECNLCQRTFSRKQRLNEHLKLHKKYELANIPMRKFKPKIKDDAKIVKEE